MGRHDSSGFKLFIIEDAYTAAQQLPVMTGAMIGRDVVVVEKLTHGARPVETDSLSRVLLSPIESTALQKGLIQFAIRTHSAGPSQTTAYSNLQTNLL